MGTRFNSNAQVRRTASLPASDNFTFAFWGMRAATTNTYAFWLTLENATADASATIGWGSPASDFDNVYIYTTSSTFVGLGKAYTDGKPFFAAYSSLGTAYFRYHDELAFTTASATANTFTSALLAVGGDSFSGENINGRVWNVKVWDREVPAAELLIESYYRRVMFPANIHLHWPLDRHDDLNDYSGNGRTGTYNSVGSLTTEDAAEGLWRPRRRIFIPAAASGQTVAVGTATENDSAFAIAIRKMLGVNLALENDSAFAVAAQRRYSVALATENDSAQTVSRTKRYGVGSSTENDSAAAVTIGAQTIAVGMAQENDSAFSINRIKRLAIGLATEIDFAFQVLTNAVSSVVDGAIRLLLRRR